MGKVPRLVRPRKVTGRGRGLCSRSGLVWLAQVADWSGLTGALSQGLAGLGRRSHDPGRTIGLLVLALADGATAMADVSLLAGLRGLFGRVPSPATVWRTLGRVTSTEIRGLWAADRRSRAAVMGVQRSWSRLVIDIDATIVTTRSNKQDAAGTFKKSFGFHPLVALIADLREVLTVMVRPGNAGSNTAADHVLVLDAAIEALGDEAMRGHHRGDPADTVTVELVARTDAAGQTRDFVAECADRNIRYSVGAAVTASVRRAIENSVPHDWMAARPDRKRNNGQWLPDDDPPQVADLTTYVNLKGWPEGSRLIVKAETPAMYTQLSLFDTVEGKRHTAIITDLAGDPASIEFHHRQRGAAEAVIRDLKACGFDKWPSEDIVTNETWATCCALAFNLLSRAQRLTLATRYHRATPKTIRNRFLHIAGQLSTTGRVLHLDQDWPWTPAITTALTKLHDTPPPTVTNQVA